MRIHAYIRVVGDETLVRAIQSEANLQNATIRETKAPIGNSSDAKWWNWSTPRVPLGEDSPDDGLKELLSRYRPVFPIIRKRSGPNCAVYLQLLTEYETNEEPRGLYLSSETIGLLHELGGALDNDVVA